MRKKKILLASCAVILLCVSIITGMSYALFTDSLKVENHLQAGNLKIDLWRTNLKTCVLSSDGNLVESEDRTAVSFNDANGNIFGASNVVVAPGSYFEATMKLQNNGNVACNYAVSIKLNGTEENALAKQLKVVVNGDEENAKYLSDYVTNGTIFSGNLGINGASTSEFTVRVEFVLDGNNNAAQDGDVNFDMFVSATQKTAA